MQVVAWTGWIWIAVAGILAAGAAAVLWLASASKLKGVRAELSATRAALEQQRTIDPLTGLSTLAAFDEALDAIAAQCDQRGAEASVLLIEIDHFRSVSEAYGAGAGDEALRNVGERLRAVGKDRQPAARLGGDTFAMAVPGNALAAQSMANAIAAALGEPMRTAAGTLRLGCSIGIVSYPGQPRRMLLDKASMALQDAKALGRGSHVVFDPSQESARRDSARVLHDLRGALENRELFLHFQPKIDATSLQITAAEVLVRWRHPATGVVSPDRFIPLAERYGLIEPIGRWVIEEACRQAAIWRDQGMRMRIAVNISGDQMRQADFVDHLASTLQRHNMQPSRFTCEITESIAMADTSATRATFERLRLLGVHVSIDDFGTGHSSLASLKRLPAAELKIDRAFVTDLATSEHARFIAETIVKMAHALDMRVVAEGVENRQQRDLLVAMGCDELQGYLFARPMPAEDLSMWSARDQGSNAAAFRPSIFAETAPNRIN